MIEISVHIPAYLSGEPFAGESVEITAEAVRAGEHIGALTLRMGISVMNGAIELLGILTHDLHAVNLATAGPLTVGVLIICHQPERRKITLTLRHFCPNLKKTVGKGLFVLSIDSTGCVAGDDSACRCIRGKRDVRNGDSAGRRSISARLSHGESKLSCGILAIHGEIERVLTGGAGKIHFVQSAIPCVRRTHHHYFDRSVHSTAGFEGHMISARRKGNPLLLELHMPILCAGIGNVISDRPILYAAGCLCQRGIVPVRNGLCPAVLSI